MSLKYIDILPSKFKKPSVLIVCLHGWGSNAGNVSSLFRFFQLPTCQFVFPHAPFSYAYSPTGKQWYDLQPNNMYEGFVESRQLLQDFLLSLASRTGIPLSQTILSDFSQGGAMTLDLGLELPLAGLVSMSGYLHADSLKQEISNTLLKALIMHGKQDKVVPLAAAIQAKVTLQSLGVAVKYHEFDMGHEMRPPIVKLFQDFVISTVQKKMSQNV